MKEGLDYFELAQQAMMSGIRVTEDDYVGTDNSNVLSASRSDYQCPRAESYSGFR